MEYTTDEEYQAVFQALFSAYREEDVGREETEYDVALINKGLHIFYSTTKDCPLWVDLYTKAAAEFLSEDPELGLPVLLSYYYLRHFVPLYHLYMEKGADDPVFLHDYGTLMQLLSSS